MNVKELQEEFQREFSQSPDCIVKCPGRVNLIGEHIDYNGYGVLPMAISAATVILVSSTKEMKIAFRNLDKQYRPYDYKLDEKWIGSAKPEWYHYFLCGWKGILDHFKLPPLGMNVLLSGTIPPSAGLSSSSSIVCASALATLVLRTGKGFDAISKVEFAELCAKVERYVGMEGGGMDQAIEVLADEGCALKIDFNPLRFRPVYLPRGALFAVVHCGITHNKAAGSLYNERVVECRLAAQIIAKSCGELRWRAIKSLGELAEVQRKSPREMLEVVKEVLHSPAYTKSDILEILELSEEELERSVFTADTRTMTTFKLAQRATHVYKEAERVELFDEACRQGDVKKMGKLMNESHLSCRDLYECSCPELNLVVEDCLLKGALGARLTGAGWGGCAVALYESASEKLDVLFWSRPAGGIEIVKS